MPRPRDAVVWNEDLVRALRAREDQCRQQGSRRQYGWRDGAVAIEAVRSDIYQFRTGRIVGLPDKLSKTIANECIAIIEGRKPIFPPGYLPTTAEERELVPDGNPYDNDPYLKKIKARGGAYAILLAFHHSTQKTLNKEQICRAAQPFCDEQMKENYLDGRTYGAWKSKDTLVKHGLLTQNNTRQFGDNGWRSNGVWTWTLNDNGKQFIEALLKKFPQGAQRPNNFQQATPVGVHDFGNAVNDIGGAIPNLPFSMMNGSPIMSPVRRGRRTALVDKDEQELRDWLETAQPGEQHKFRVGKDRRKFIHDLCQELEAQTPGLRLRHESAGDVAQRALYVTVVSRGNVASMPTVHNSRFAILSSSVLADDTPSLDSEGRFNSPVIKTENDSQPKRSAPLFEGVCRQLVDGDSLLRRPQVSAREAAANAAFLRQAMVAPKREPERTVPNNIPEAAFEDDTAEEALLRIAMEESKSEFDRSASQQCPAKRQLSHDINDEVDLDEVPYEIQNARVASNKASKQENGIYFLNDDDDDNDEEADLLRKAMTESKAEYERSATRKSPPKRQRSFDVDDSDSAELPKQCLSAALPTTDEWNLKPATSNKANKHEDVYDSDDNDEAVLLQKAMKESKVAYERAASSWKPLSKRQKSLDDEAAAARLPKQNLSAVLPNKEDLDRKPAATNKATKYGVVYLYDSDDDDLPCVVKKPAAASARHKQSPLIIDLNDSVVAEAKSRHFNDDDEVIDLADSQEVLSPVQLSASPRSQGPNLEHVRENNEKEEEDDDDEIIDLSDSQEMISLVQLSSSNSQATRAREQSANSVGDDDIIDLADSQEIEVRFNDDKADAPTGREGETVDEDNNADPGDSQESVAMIVNPYTARAGTSQTTLVEPNSNCRKLTIIVDDRERLKNAKPRDLRIELMRHMESGALNSVWPSNLQAPEVIERKLDYGDFAFALGDRRLPLSIERKKVSDLVGRSVKGDHWKQLQRIRDCCRCAIILIEGDTRSASRFPAHGAQDREEWNPAYHRIDDEESIFRFVGRAILLSSVVKFIQAKEVQATHRAVGALGLIAALSEQEHPSQGVPNAIPSASSAQTVLYDRLIQAGIPWELSRRVADEVGSVKKLDSLYNECASDECKSALLCPIISSTQPLGSTSSKEDWSDAIFRCYFSTFNDPSVGRDRFDEYKGLVKNQAILLSAVHAEQDDEAAIEVALSANSRPVLPPRKVAIELTDGLRECFEVPTEASFYSLSVEEQEDDSDPIQKIVMQTSAGNLVSNKLFVHVVPAKVLLAMIQKSVSHYGDNFVRAATSTAERIDQDCKIQDWKFGLDRRVIIFHGMMAACDAAAKQPGYRAEVRVVIDLVMAALMYTHNIVVLQAVRQTTDLALIVRQLALACFHYQLLTREKAPVS